MTYFETMPNSCPPDDCRDPGDYTLYRVCWSNPAKEDDFTSWRHINPDKSKPANVTECQARSISMQGSLAELRKKFKSPRLRKKFRDKTIFIAEVTLKPEDGPNKQTLGPGHYSWWRSVDFSLDASIVSLTRV